MVQKNRARLIVVGVLLIAAAGISFYFSAFLVPGVILSLTGVYLLLWATLGRGGWCRACKKFSLF